MNSLQSLLLVIGIAMCAMVILQMGMWAAQSLTLMGLARRQFELSRQVLKQQIDSVSERRLSSVLLDPENGFGHTWAGYRTFVVSEMVTEAKAIVSVYLKPDDGKPIAAFTPGQHLTIKVPVPGQTKPIVRCYSLSSAPDRHQYRISVKAITTELKSETAQSGGQPVIHEGLASNFINQSICVGDRIEVKAPAGNFVLDESSELPVVLLAGGIGITPMISMLEHLRVRESNRLVVLLYGVSNSQECAFKETINRLTDGDENLHAIKCFSRPLSTDVPHEDFEVEGYVSVDLLKQILPNNHCQFYLCGPPVFMQSVYDDLVQWQVPESRIFSEAFGPASIGRPPEKDVPTSGSIAAKYEQLDPVTFAATDRTILWSANHDSLLELAEANDVFSESGCRAGRCGACETAIISGKVAYQQDQTVDCSPGTCLLCIAKPDGPVELDL